MDSFFSVASSKKPKLVWLVAPWAANSKFAYYFRHPLSRIAVCVGIIPVNFYIYSEDPIAESHVQARIPLAGNAFSFVFTKWPSASAYPGLFLTRFMLLVTFSWLGLAFGRIYLHKRLLRDRFGMRMFGGGSAKVNVRMKAHGSWVAMIVSWVSFLLLGSIFWNGICSLFLKQEWQRQELLISAYIGLSNADFARLAAMLCCYGDGLTALVVMDAMLQDRHHYLHWAPKTRAFWSTAWSGWFRVYVFWTGAIAVIALGPALFYSDTLRWARGSYPSSRIYTSLLVMALDIFIVMQDWQFPEFIGTDEILLPGMRSNDIEVIHGDEDEDEAESQAHASRATHYTSAFGLFYALLVVPVCGKSSELHVSGKWVNYGILIAVMGLDLNMYKNQMLYEPDKYGQCATQSESLFDGKPHTFSFESGSGFTECCLPWNPGIDKGETYAFDFAAACESIGAGDAMMVNISVACPAQPLSISALKARKEGNEIHSSLDVCAFTRSSNSSETALKSPGFHIPAWLPLPSQSRSTTLLTVAKGLSLLVMFALLFFFVKMASKSCLTQRTATMIVAGLTLKRVVRSKVRMTLWLRGRVFRTCELLGGVPLPPRHLALLRNMGGAALRGALKEAEDELERQRERQRDTHRERHLNDAAPAAPAALGKHLYAVGTDDALIPFVQRAWMQLKLSERHCGRIRYCPARHIQLKSKHYEHQSNIDAVAWCVTGDKKGAHNFTHLQPLLVYKCPPNAQRAANILARCIQTRLRTARWRRAQLLRVHELLVAASGMKYGEELQAHGHRHTHFWPLRTSKKAADDDNTQNDTETGCRWGVRRLLILMNSQQAHALFSVRPVPIVGRNQDDEIMKILQTTTFTFTSTTEIHPLLDKNERQGSHILVCGASGDPALLWLLRAAAVLGLSSMGDKDNTWTTNSRAAKMRNRIRAAQPDELRWQWGANHDDGEVWDWCRGGGVVYSGARDQQTPAVASSDASAGGAGCVGHELPPRKVSIWNATNNQIEDAISANRILI